MPTLRLFASAREAAGVARVDLEGSTVAEVLEQARGRFGERFTRVLATSRVWVNGQPADDTTPVSGFDVVAVLPPVSGGAAAGARPLHLVPEPGPRPPSGPVPAEPAPPPHRSPPVEVTAREATLDPLPALRLVRAPSDAVSDAVAGAVARRQPGRLPGHPSEGPSAAVGGGHGPALARALVPDVASAPANEPEPRPHATVTGTASRSPKAGPPLAVVPKPLRPHGRLGLAWAVVVTAATTLGPVWLAVWLAVAALVAAFQVAMVWLARNERPLPAFAAATAAALPLAAVSGVGTMNIVVVVALVATLLARLGAPTKAPSRDVALTLVIGLAVGLAAASPVLLRDINVHAPLFLLAIAATYDAGAYLVGTGAASAWEGPVAGIAATIPLTMFAAIVLVPPFGGAAPIVLGALGALLAPFGPLAGSALLGDATATAPALRRLDSLLVLGPVWAWCAAAFLL